MLILVPSIDLTQQTVEPLQIRAISCVDGCLGAELPRVLGAWGVGAPETAGGGARWSRSGTWGYLRLVDGFGLAC